MQRHLLLYRFILFNVAALIVIAYGLSLDIIELAGPRVGQAVLSAICLLYLTCLWSSVHWAYRISRDLNNPYIESRLPRLDLVRAKTAWMHDASSWLVGLGLIGTVVGFSLALSGVDRGALSSASGVQGVVTTLLAGMRIALDTTIAGAVLALVNEMSQRILKTGISRLG